MWKSISIALGNAVAKAFIDPFLIKAVAHIKMIKDFSDKVNILLEESSFFCVENIIAL